LLPPPVLTVPEGTGNNAGLAAETLAPAGGGNGRITGSADPVSVLDGAGSVDDDLCIVEEILEEIGPDSLSLTFNVDLRSAIFGTRCTLDPPPPDCLLDDCIATVVVASAGPSLGAEVDLG
jgi:hypothetical protein